MRLTTIRRNSLYRTCLFAACFLAAFVFLLWKCRYGFAREDETFYLTVPYRLLQGDGLFVHEWHLSQMSSVLLLPFVFLYTKLTGGTEGIFLASRCLYTVVWSVGALCLWRHMRLSSRTAAAAASLSFMLFAPYEIMALSYNSMGILFLSLVCVRLCAQTGRRKRDFALTGFLFALSVLCCPYLIAVYALYSVGAVVFAARRKESRKQTLCAWGFFTIGAAAVFVLFAGFVLSRAGVSQILSALPDMLRDPEHSDVGLLQKVKYYVGGILLQVRYVLLVYAAAACTAVLAWILRRRPGAKAVFFLLTLLEIAALLVLTRTQNPYISFFMFPLNLFPVVMLPFLRDDASRRWLCFGYLPGMLYTICIHMASNQMYFAVSAASTVALLPSLWLLTACTKSIRLTETRQAVRTLCTAAFLLVIGLQLCLQTAARYRSVSKVDDMASQTCPVTQGPEKGLLARDDLAAEYLTLLRETEPIRADARTDSVLYLSKHTWLYLLDGGKRNASFSAWLSGVNAASLSRLDAYYALNPDKLPDAVYYAWNEAPQERARVTAWLETQYGFKETTVGAYGSVFTKP